MKTLIKNTQKTKQESKQKMKAKLKKRELSSITKDKTLRQTVFD